MSETVQKTTLAATSALLALPALLPTGTAFSDTAAALGWKENTMIMYGPSESMVETQKKEHMEKIVDQVVGFAVPYAVIGTVVVAGTIVAVTESEKRKSGKSREENESERTHRPPREPEDEQ